MYWQTEVSRLVYHEFDNFYEQEENIELPVIVKESRNELINNIQNRVVDYFSFSQYDPVMYLDSQLSVEAVYWGTISSWNYIKSDNIYYSRQKNEVVVKKWLESFKPVVLKYSKSVFEVLTGTNRACGILRRFVSKYHKIRYYNHLDDNDFKFLLEEIPVPLVRSISKYAHLESCSYCQSRFKDFQKSPY